MPIGIPLSKGLPAFTVQIPLDSVTYTFSFRWNVRGSGWFLDILNEDGTTIIRPNIRLVANWFIGAYSLSRTPPGLLMAYDSSGTDQDPAFNDLGDRVKLIYWTAAEVAAMISGL